MLLCPKCHMPLERQEKIYRCPQGHCYDIAKEGYVNLILANQKHSTDPGDNKESLNARNNFLNKGYYSPLAEALKGCIDKYFENEQIFLDAGTGTGYYLEYINHRSKKKLKYYATDISKKGVGMASRKVKEAECFVGNVFHLPFEDGALDGLMSVFCPYSAEEFSRVIKQGGYVISVTPGAYHLYDLKEIVYQQPYLNNEEGYDLPDFTLVEKFNVKYTMHLESNEDIASLWRMMPYYHTTSQQDTQKLYALDKVNSKADFLVCVYRKEAK